MKWSELLPQEALDLSTQLEARAQEEREQGAKIYPSQEQIFRALTLTTPDTLKVCIVGQDPYHTPGAANGLAFSITDGCPIQPSLKNIFKELNSDLDLPIPRSGDLTKWAENGVLLLNNSLTVYEHQANSCVDWGWNKFTGAVLKAAASLPQPIVFILWGANAHNFLNILPSSPTVRLSDSSFIERMKKNGYILSSHPSPLSVTRPCKTYPAFRGSKPFSKANELLSELGGDPVDWTL